MPNVKQYESEKKEDWITSKWRPMMGWMYMSVCMCDFVLFPILWSLIQIAHGGRVETQWQPITLQGAGLFHMAMGAIMGVAAFGRTQEKLAGINNGMNSSYTNNFVSGNNVPSTGFNNVAPNTTVPRTAYTGRSGPAPQIDPPL